MIKLGNLNIAEIYLGDYKVSKMYAGDEVIYDQSSPTPGGTSIYDSNGNLIIPAGTVCQIRDYSGGGDPVTTEYVLPSDIVISGTDGEVTLSDGQRVRYRASITEQSYSKVARLTRHVPNNNWRDVRTYTNDLTSYLTYYGNNWYRGFKYKASENLRVGLPLGVFSVSNIPEGYDETYLYNCAFYKETYFKQENVKGYYLHEDSGDHLDNGWYKRGFDIGETGMISEDDRELVASGSSTGWMYLQDPGTYHQISIEPNKLYLIYCIMKANVSPPSTETFGDEYDLPIRQGEITIESKKTIYHYDEPLSVRLDGYKFGEEQDVQVSISRYDYPEKLGTTKINEELKYYDTVPVNEE